MNKERNKMNLELFGISIYRTCLFARRFLWISLAIYFNYAIANKAYCWPVFYMTFLTFAFPFAFEIFLPKRTLEKTTPYFSQAWKRFDYQPKKARNHCFALFADSIILFLWQFTTANEFSLKIFSFFPSILGVFILLFFFFGTPIVYAIYKCRLGLGRF